MFKIYVSHRVTRSVLSGETIKLFDSFDETFAVRSQLEQVNGRAALLYVLTTRNNFFILDMYTGVKHKNLMKYEHC